MEEEQRPSARADLYGGAFWIALGVVISVASWRMDRLERLGVSFFTAPGLLPGILGVIIVVCGATLLLRSLPEGLGRIQRPALLLNRDALGKAGLTLLLSLGFAVGLVGRGVPFWLAATIYLFAQIAVLERKLARAAIVAPPAAVAIALLFERVFLVRLP
jgi:hypothetical protein